jgi:parvulin-like peptidyl-prolyl isomerase
MSRMMRWMMIVMTVMIATTGSAAAADGPSRTVDRTIRYVNDSIISLGDVLQRNAMRFDDYEKRGRPRPTSREDMLVFFAQSLSELTDEELLIQYGRALAHERGFQLIDHERISQKVMEIARSSGRGRSLRQQAEQRKLFERQEIIDLVLGYFDSRTPHISPQKIEFSYHERESEFLRPARAKVLQILLRPSTPAEYHEVRQDRIAVFKAAQDVTDAKIRAASEQRIEAYTVASPEGQERLLAEAVQEIALESGRTDLDVGSDLLAKKAKAIEAHVLTLRDAATTRKELEALRIELATKDIAAFKDAAKRLSQGPGAADGGDLGWVEPGTNNKAFDQLAYVIPVGELSPVFMMDANASIVVVTERTEPYRRTLGEMVGEIESALRREQMKTIRANVVAMMQEKASIRDLVTIQKLFE